MGSIRPRGAGDCLQLDFRYKGMRFREQTALPDNAANRKKLKQLLDRIEAEITLGTFEYRRYFPNSKNADKVEQQLNYERQFTRMGDNPLFEIFADTWYDEMRVTWRDSYASTIKILLETRIKPYFKDRKVDQITKAELLQFRASLGKVRREDGKALSADYINRHLKVLQMILSEAADRFQFSAIERLKPAKVKKTDVDPFTLDEINRILSHADIAYRDLLTVAFFTGMRTGEILGLKWRYVDFSNDLILIRETIVNGKEEYTKTDGSQREIAMSAPVKAALQRQQQRTANGIYVFSNSTGKPLCRHNLLKRKWYPLLEKLELRKRRQYQTRHTAATLWLAAGENPEWIARQMGHTTTEMLFRVYSRFVPNLTRQDGSAFERLVLQHVEVQHA